MDNTGRLKIHRKITERERYSDVNVRLVFLHLLFSVNHKEKKRQGQTIGPGEIITSYGSLAASVGLSVQQTRTALKKLQSTGEINQQSTNKWQRVILINWGKYQAKENDSNKQTTNEEQTNNNQTTNNQQQLKNDKNIRTKEGKNIVSVILPQATLDAIARFVDRSRSESKGIDNAINKKGLEYYLSSQCEEVEKLHRLDGYTFDQINYIIDRIPQDRFRSQQVYSLANVRKKKPSDPLHKFDKIFNQIKQSAKSTQGQTMDLSSYDL